MAARTEALPVTVLVAARNEIANIRRCLSSCVGRVVRVLVVDSQSTDGTSEAARDLGADVADFDYSGGYPRKRQWALDTQNIATPWVFLLDADETMPEALWTEIASVVEAQEPAAGYLVTKQFHFLGRRFRFGGFSHAAVLLFRTGKARFERLIDEPVGGLDMEVHERLIVDGPIGSLHARLEHEDHKGMEAYLQRHRQYAEWQARLRQVFLTTGSFGSDTIRPRLFGNEQERRRFLKHLAIRIPCEPILWFLYHYFVRGAFLEGYPGYVASRIRASHFSEVRRLVRRASSEQRRRGRRLPDTRPRIHVWISGIQQSGGIQHYSACLVMALAELYPDHRITVLSKLDTTHGAAPFSFANSVAFKRFGGWPSFLRTIAFAATGLAYALSQRPRFVLSSHPHFARVFPWIRRITRVPCFATSHGRETWGNLRGGLLRGLSACTGILPVSEFTRRVLLYEGMLDSAKIAVVPNTFREDVFAPGPKPERLLKKYGLDPDTPVIMTVGRLVAEEGYKGHESVIASLSTIRLTEPRICYIIVGTGNDESRLRALVQAHNQTDAVIFVGFVSEDDLPDHYRLCNVFVMPSTGEGFGIVYLEALASGRPCIAGNRDASAEALGTECLGLVVDPKSTQQIATAVLTLLRPPPNNCQLRDPEYLSKTIRQRFGFRAFTEHLKCALASLTD